VWNGSSFTATNTGISASTLPWGHVADVDGDGLDDLVNVAIVGSTWASGLELTVRRNTTTGGSLSFAAAAHRELTDDLSYLSKIPDGGTIECPTCGVNHQTSFHARLELAKDADSMSALVVELNAQFDRNRTEEAKLRSALSEIGKSLSGLDVLAETSKARLKLDDVLGAHSKKTIDKAFSRVSGKLHDELSKLHELDDDLMETVKQFEDKERVKRVREYYSNQLGYLSETLHIPGHERVDHTKIGSRPASGGSSGPRAVLAVHIAMLASNVEHGDTVRFPFVVDTPQQSGQDEANLHRMIDSIMRFAGQDHTVILAVERLPENTDVTDFTVIRFEEKGALLRTEEFEEVSRRLASNYQMLKDAVEEEGSESAEAETEF
jgi:hypothetical protein